MAAGEAPRTASVPSWVSWTAVAAPFYAACCFLMVGGLATSKPWGDVDNYERYARRILAGELPYGDFYVEYPPGALPVFVFPALFTDSATTYLIAFKASMAVLGLALLGTVAFLLDRLGRSGLDTAVALGTVAVSPVALGWVFLNRYDVWPTLLTAVALAAVVAGRTRLAAAWLSLAIAAKIFPAATIPAVATYVWRSLGRNELARTAAVFVAASIALYGTFAVAAFGGIGFSYYSQVTRCLQIESLGASVLLVAGQLGVYDPRPGGCSPGSIDLDGGVADAVAAATSVAQGIAVLALAVVFARGPQTTERLVLAFAASITAFTVLAKVLSPQFLVWLIPVVVLVRGRTGRAAVALLLAALVTTQVQLHGYVGLSIDDWAVWVLALRNALLVCLLVVLASAVWSTAYRVPA